MAKADYRIVEGARPGWPERMVSLHADYYCAHWSFGPVFAAKVAAESAAFFERYDEKRDRAWFVVRGDGVAVGSLVIDGAGAAKTGHGARLRWFILADECRGQGLGDALMRRAVDFCDAQGYPKIYLTTFAGLDAARRLYERSGFVLTGEKDDRTWGRVVREQVFERERPPRDAAVFV